MLLQPLNQLYDEHDGKVSDKWSLYLSEYDRIFSPYRDEPVRILEIGVQNGGSLEILAKYFPRAALILGCDINPACGTLTFDDDRIAVVVGDVNADETEREIAGLAEKFDIVIDDGSHRSSDIIRAFARYFPHLAETGLYVVEDLHCSYWQEFEGGLHHPLSSISFFKRLVDVINHEHWGLGLSAKQAVAVFAGTDGLMLDDRQLASIHAVTFLNSLCIVTKRPIEENLLGGRRVEGTGSPVAAGMAPLKGTMNKAVDQTGNPWSPGSTSGDEETQTSRELQMKAWIDALAGDLAQARKDVAQAQAETGARLAETHALRADLADTAATKASLEQELARHELEIRELRASTSWRMTAPLRMLSAYSKRLLGEIHGG